MFFRVRPLLPFLLCGIAACIDTAAPLEEDVAFAQEELSVFDWSSPTTVGPDRQGAHLGGAVVTVDLPTGARTIMVHSGACDDCRELWWTERINGAWTEDRRVPNQTASERVSLAAYNGKIYMIHTGYHPGSTEVWMSRFDPAHDTWSGNVRLDVSSVETPALATFGGLLHMVGVSTYQRDLWHMSMGTSEVFSSRPFLGSRSASRPSLAVFNSRLYVAHRNDRTSTIVYSRFTGSSWTYISSIPAGPGGRAIEGARPVIATYDNVLHLVYKISGSEDSTEDMEWTTFDGTRWAPAQRLPGHRSYGHPDIARAPDGLILTHNRYCGGNTVCSPKNPLYTSIYRSPN